MKKMMIVLLSLGLALGAAAQRGHGGGGFHHGGGYYVRPRISVGLGYYAPFGPFGYGYYSPFYMYPYGPYAYPYGGYRGKTSQLSANVQDIKQEYADKIYSAKQDTRITHKQRRQEVRALKRERDKAIQDEIMNYYKRSDNRNSNRQSQQ